MAPPRPRAAIFPFYPCLLLLLLLLLLLQPSPTLSNKVPRLSIYRKNSLIEGDPNRGPLLAKDISNDMKIYYYNQTLDHFNYAPQSYQKFVQRYAVNSAYWGGPNAPIFAYLGAEESMDLEMRAAGFVHENAIQFNALIVFIEHRFYGESNPSGSMSDAISNKTVRGYFSSSQSIADYAEVLLHVKRQFSVEKSPIVVFGGSYGGMLASWFRLKYPHIAIGALASSAPILYFEDITPEDGYYSVVSKDFQAVSTSCHDTIKKSWFEINVIASQPDGLSILSRRFNTCSLLTDTNDLRDALETVYMSAAQYDAPPTYPVKNLCAAIDGAIEGADVIDRVLSGINAYFGGKKCLNIGTNNNPGETDLGWSWQTCSEMVMPIGNGNDTMFLSPPFDLQQFYADCMKSYGVPPRPHWITTYYGGHDIKLVLSKFGSNIIFSNGLRDPYSSGGVLENLSDSIIALTTQKGSHCLDILPSSVNDPDWLVKQRKIEIKIIDSWIKKYYADLIVLIEYSR